MSCHVFYSITYCFAIKYTNSYIQTEFTAQNIDPRLSTKIVQYAKGATNVREMKRLLKIFAKNDLFSGQNLPDCNNDDITQVLQLFVIDPECLLYKIEEQKNADKFFSIFYRAKTKEQMEKENEPNSFLFVRQSKWQKYLLRRYGSELILLDATYKTTRYSLPLFFLTVKTNMDYQQLLFLLRKMKRPVNNRGFNYNQVMES